MKKLFSGQTVVVVGAASGIGKATAKTFELEGATVYGLDKVAPQPETRDEQQTQRFFKVDATDYPRLVDTSREIDRIDGRIDHVVVSIGLCTGKLGFPFWNVPPADWGRSVNVNLIAPINVAHAFVPYMLPLQRGTICFVASVAGQIGSQTDPPYSAAKAGLINFTQCAAKDLAAYSIRVNAVSPGMVKTNMNRQVWQAWRDASVENDLKYEDWAESKIRQVAPLGRWQTHEDIAEAICFLASSKAKNITGQTLNVDGGQVMHA